MQQKNVKKRQLYLAMNYILQTEIAKHRLGREGILITRVRLMQVGLPVLVKWLLGGKVMTLSFLKDGGCYVSVCIFYIFYFNLHICRNYAA